MKQMMKQSDIRPVRWLVGAWSLVMVLAVAQAGFGQQAAKSAMPVAQVAGAPSVNAFEPAALSALMPGAAASRPAAKAVAEDEEQAAKPSGEGIKVHGHWVLQVKNPDGTLGERREFNNSLVTGGANLSGDQLLAALITGEAAAGGLGVTLLTGTTAGEDPTNFCSTSGSSPSGQTVSGVGCYSLLDANTTLLAWPFENTFLGGLGGPNDAGYQIGLTTTVSFSPSVNIVLSGNYTAGCTLNQPSFGVYNLVCNGASMPPITAVQTYLAVCGNPTNLYGISVANEAANTQQNYNRFTGSNLPIQQSTVTSNACTRVAQSNQPNAVSMGAFTSTALPGGPLMVNPGQVITVTVTISFS